MQLFPLPPVLTERQQRALDAITAAGWDGLSSDELGAHLHQHPDGSICQWCPSTGNDVGKALRNKQLVRQRRRKAPGGDHFMVWVTADAKPCGSDSGEIPY